MSPTRSATSASSSFAAPPTSSRPSATPASNRGRRLKERPGKQVHEIRCPFHFWAWHLDGSLKEIPCQWDFPYIDPAEQDLPEVPVGRWGRFIFINPDRDCEPFEEFLDDFPSNFELLPYEKRHKVAEVRKIIRANWKVAQDAFAESWHVFSTHPQVVWGFGDCNAQFDAFKSYSRQHNPSGAPSPHLEGIEWTPLPPSTDGVPRERHAFTGAIYERRPDGNVDVTMPDGKHGVFTQEAVWVDGELGHADLHLCQWVAGPQVGENLRMPPPGEPEASTNGASPGENGSAPDGSELYAQIEDDAPPAPTLPQTRDERVRATAAVRAKAAANMREAMRPLLGDVVDKVCDSELTGNIYFNLFPNQMPSSAFGPLAIWFRFRPNGNNPEECIMEAICIAPTPEGTEPPPAPPAPSPALQRPPLTRCRASAACANSTGERTRLFAKAIITRMRSVAIANVVAVTHTCGWGCGEEMWSATEMIG